MKDIIKSLKDLGLEIVNSDSTATKDWLKTTAKLYEQLLLTDYLEKRNASLNAIEDELVERIGQVTASTPIEIKQPEATSPVIESLGQEIREVPIPQGPPVSNIQESIYEEPEPLIEKKIEDFGRRAIQTLKQNLHARLKILTRMILLIGNRLEN